MKAEELRIGNLIFWDIPEKLNTIHEVIGIRNKKPQTIPISLGESIEDYKPIPLTEEWLLKFEKIDWVLKDDKGFYFLFNNKKVRLKFVHTVQNVYFYIEQKELLCANT